MAFDSQEMRRRRIRREEDRKRRQQKAAQQKKILIRLGIAGVVLILVGVLIWSVSREQPGGPSDPVQNMTQAPVVTNPPVTQPPETVPKETEPTTVIHLVAGGDLNINDATVAGGGLSYDYGSVFLDVAHLLANADIAALNFEGILYGEPYGTEFGSAPQQMVKALSNAGVDLLQAANSRSISNGLLGLTATLQSIRNAGMEPLGAYATNEEFEKSGGYTIRHVEGIKIAFVAFTKGMDGMALPEGSEKCVNLLYKDYSTHYQEVDTQGITDILERLQEEEAPDLVVAMLHWGSEFNDELSKTQKQICALMQEQGVDAIIGTHSHYVQQIDYDPETGKFVAYSLGDFLSDAKTAGTEYSILLDLEITKDNFTGQTRVTDFSYTPIFSAVDPEDGTIRVLRIHQAMEAYESNFLNRVPKDIYDDMAYALGRIEDRVTADE